MPVSSDDEQKPVRNSEWSAYNYPPLSPLKDLLQIFRDVKRTIEFHNSSRSAQIDAPTKTPKP